MIEEREKKSRSEANERRAAVAWGSASRQGAESSVVGTRASGQKCARPTDVALNLGVGTLAGGES
jgi:hypothetical protein